MSSIPALQIVHVFPGSARVACGPCDAIKTFMESQAEYGLRVSAISPMDDGIDRDRSRPIEHLPIREFDLEREAFPSMPELQCGPGRRVFHFHGISPWSDRLARHLKKAGTPYVFTSHGHLHFRDLVHGLKKAVYLSLFNSFIRQAGGLHFLTRREMERSHFILPGWRKKILVQPNLVRLPDRDSISAAPRDSLGIPPDAFVFAYLGRLDVRHKGLDLLVEAFSRLSPVRAVHLLLIGPDFAGGRQVLEELAKKLGCEKSLHFTGPKVAPDKWELLKTADAFISPSRWEAFSIAMVEAIGFGLPTVVSDEINCAAEMAAGRAALISGLSPDALAAAMNQLITDASLRRSLAESGREWVLKTCSYAAAGPRFAEFYESVGQ
jgi:glycosyltransferase involved in cell wall biosynthesis